MIAAAAVIVVAAVAAAVLAGLGQAPEREQVVIRWATSKPASAGYRAMTVLAKVVKEADPTIVIEPVATPGAVAGMKGFARGE